MFLPYFILFIQNMNASYYNLPNCMIPFQLVDHYILRRVLPVQFSVDSSLLFHLRRLQNTVPRHSRLHTYSLQLKCKTKIAVKTRYISFVITILDKKKKGIKNCIYRKADVCYNSPRPLSYVHIPHHQKLVVGRYMIWFFVLQQSVREVWWRRFVSKETSWPILTRNHPKLQEKKMMRA